MNLDNLTKAECHELIAACKARISAILDEDSSYYVVSMQRLKEHLVLAHGQFSYLTSVPNMGEYQFLSNDPHSYYVHLFRSPDDALFHAKCFNDKNKQPDLRNYSVIPISKQAVKKNYGLEKLAK